MKKLFLALMAIAAIALTGCEKKSDGTSGGTSEKVETISATDITSNGALLTGQVGVEIADYKSVEFGMLISQRESDVSSYEGKKLVGNKLLGQTFSVTATGLSAYTQYYYRAYLVLNNMQYEYGDIKSFKTEKGGTGGNHQYVDLGLSVKWATCNVGASKPEEYGDYFAWGETSPKTIYEWSNYKYCNGWIGSMTKYCIHSEHGYNRFTDGKTTLDLSDDAAHVNWGGNWRMPTKAEQDELDDNCTWTWTALNGVNGYLVKSKKNGNSIFLPASGCHSHSSPSNVGSTGYYWSSSLDEYNSDLADYYLFNSDGVYCYGNGRANGQSVRAVCE